ncbi:MAG TPA: hypothetical protein VE445_05095 [Nitrososphaeraceae archaeon]|jgi:hypothetical protein|nr:hypothetical protein [Nitrososphaeraceae archaeon]HZB73782.1 hypothetical protein [Nitrososphaeraceae archaeon]
MQTKYSCSELALLEIAVHKEMIFRRQMSFVEMVLSHEIVQKPVISIAADYRDGTQEIES